MDAHRRLAMVASARRLVTHAVRRPVAVGSVACGVAALSIGVALLAAGGCGARTTPAATSGQHVESGSDSPKEAATAGPRKPPPTGGRLVHMTLYYLASQKCPDPAQVALPHCGGGAIAKVSNAFKKSAALQGSAKLCDGRVVGVRKIHPLCFVVVPENFPWGMTASGRPATPFRSIAVDPKLFPMGRWYYVPELDGMPLPAPAAGKVHDGCVRSDDVGGAVKGDSIDLFVGDHAAVESLKVKLSEASLHLADGTGYCENAGPL